MSSKVLSSPCWRHVRMHPDCEVREYCTIHESVIGAGAVVMERVSLRRCVVAPGAFINAGCVLENVFLGRDAQIGPNCSIVGIWHEVGEYGPSFAHTDARQGRIHVGARALIGAGSVITPGSVIGERVVIGAGSLVTGGIPDDLVYWGRPPNTTRMMRAEYLARKTR